MLSWGNACTLCVKHLETFCALLGDPLPQDRPQPGRINIDVSHSLGLGLSKQGQKNNDKKSRIYRSIKLIMQ